MPNSTQRLSLNESRNLQTTHIPLVCLPLLVCVWRPQSSRIFLCLWLTLAEGWQDSGSSDTSHMWSNYNAELNSRQHWRSLIGKIFLWCKHLLVIKACRDGVRWCCTLFLCLRASVPTLVFNLQFCCDWWRDNLGMQSTKIQGNKWTKEKKMPTRTTLKRPLRFQPRGLKMNVEDVKLVRTKEK